MARTVRRAAEALASAAIPSKAGDGGWFPVSRRPERAFRLYDRPPTGFLGAADRLLLADLARADLPPGLDESGFRDRVRSLLRGIPLAEPPFQTTDDFTLTRADVRESLEKVETEDFSAEDIWISFVHWMAYFHDDKFMRQEISEIGLRRARIIR